MCPNWQMLCFLIPYVIGTMTQEHESLMDRLKAKIENENGSG